MKIRKNITAELTKDDIKKAVWKWMREQGWSVLDIEFNLSPRAGNGYELVGAKCMVKQADHA